MKIGVWILGDQLSLQGSAIAPLPLGSPVILIESLNHVRSRPYHQQKLVLVWSAMRHFAVELRQRGYDVTYTEAEDFSGALLNWIAAHQITVLRVMTPTDKPFRSLIHALNLPCTVEQTVNNQFIWSSEAFLQWAKSRKRLLMEDFYREGRRRFQVLMEPNGKPIGNNWNFDKENRKPPKKADPNFNPPPPLWFSPDSITQAVIEKVQTLDCPVYGEIKEFGWAVTRTQSLAVLEN